MITINTTQRVIPMMYAYTTPEIVRHNGWIKIGYTERQTVEARIKQQTHTSDTLAQLEWKSTAIYDDGSGDSFTDHDFHAYLQKSDIERKPDTEWFRISANDSKLKLMDFKQNRGILLAKGTSVPYTPLCEQPLISTLFPLSSIRRYIS